MQETILQIKNKMQLLIKQFEELKHNYTKTKKELDKFQKINSNQSQEIEDLKRKLDASNINLNELTKQDKLHLERRIDSYLKEVNTCLTILNKD